MKNGSLTHKMLARDLESLTQYSDFGQEFTFTACRNINTESALSGAVMIHTQGELPRLFDTSTSAVKFIEARLADRPEVILDMNDI